MNLTSPASSSHRLAGTFERTNKGPIRPTTTKQQIQKVGRKSAEIRNFNLSVFYFPMSNWFVAATDCIESSATETAAAFRAHLALAQCETPPLDGSTAKLNAVRPLAFLASMFALEGVSRLRCRYGHEPLRLDAPNALRLPGVHLRVGIGSRMF